MGAPTSELQKAVFAALSNLSALTAVVGTRIFDHAPANVAFPYVSFGRTSLYDWSTDAESGAEQLFTIHVWSKDKGKKQTLDLMEIVRSRLHDGALTLETNTLVNLRLEFAEARYDDDLSVYRGVLRFRAVTEPNA